MKRSLTRICLFICVGIQAQCVQSSDLWDLCKRAVVRKVVDLFDLTVEENILCTSRIDPGAVQSHQVVLKYEIDDIGVKKVKAVRLDADTVLMLQARHADGMQQLVTSAYSKAQHEQQIQEVETFVKGQPAGSQSMHAVILVAHRSREQSLLDTFMYQEKLAALGISSQKIKYPMVAGNMYRDRCHFEATLSKTGAVYRAAFDDFTERSIGENK